MRRVFESLKRAALVLVQYNFREHCVFDLES
jgi:hypothetical protein